MTLVGLCTTIGVKPGLSSKSGMRFNHSVKNASISRRARCMPKHRWMPPPNAQWRWRRTSPSLPREISSPPSVLPAASSASHTELSAGIVTPPISTSLVVSRGMPGPGGSSRKISSANARDLCWVLAQLGPQLRVACEMQKRESDC